MHAISSFALDRFVRILVATVLLISSMGSPKPAVQASEARQPAATPIDIPTETPPATDTPTDTATPSATPPETFEASPTATETPTQTETATATETPIATAAQTASGDLPVSMADGKDSGGPTTLDSGGWTDSFNTDFDGWTPVSGEWAWLSSFTPWQGSTGYGVLYSGTTNVWRCIFKDFVFSPGEYTVTAIMHIVVDIVLREQAGRIDVDSTTLGYWDDSWYPAIWHARTTSPLSFSSTGAHNIQVCSTAWSETRASYIDEISIGCD